MKTEHYQTDAQLQRQVVQLISRELGITNFIRFVQYYEQGCGNYTCDRDAWQSAYTVDLLADEIEAWKQKNR